MIGLVWRSNGCLLDVRPSSPEKSVSFPETKVVATSLRCRRPLQARHFKSQLSDVRCLFYCAWWCTVGAIWCPLPSNLLNSSSSPPAWLAPRTSLPGPLRWGLLRAAGLPVSSLEIHLWTIPSGKWEAPVCFERHENGLQGSRMSSKWSSWWFLLGFSHYCISVRGWC